MDYLGIKENECKYKKVIEGFKNSSYTEIIIWYNDKIIRELTMIKKTNDVTSEEELSWAKRAGT